MTKIAIIGCGWAGERHAGAIRALAQRVELRAIADADFDRAQAKSQEYEVPTWSTDYRKLFSTLDLDAVSICLPHQLHAEVAVEAARAGLHILVEKPLATTLDEADAMIAAAEDAGVILMVAENVRYDATYRKAAEIARSGALGDIFLVRISREHQMHSYLHRRPWFLQEASGGIMYSGGIHDFELLRMIAGEIEHVYGLPGAKALPDMVADDTSVALAGMQSGAAAVITESFSLRTPEPGVHGTVHGSEGSLWFHGDRIRLYTAPEDGQSEQVEEIEVPQRDTFVTEMAHFLDCIDNGTEPVTSGREERKALVAVVAAYESMRRGERVYLDEVDG